MSVLCSLWMLAVISVDKTTDTYSNQVCNLGNRDFKLMKSMLQKQTDPLRSPHNPVGFFFCIIFQIQSPDGEMSKFKRYSPYRHYKLLHIQTCWVLPHDGWLAASGPTWLEWWINVDGWIIDTVSRLSVTQLGCKTQLLWPCCCLLCLFTSSW